ncbi:hypothetical protein AAD018_005495 [Aestuariibius insulae]|uniref:hypothetical protein n=1 Tax=Aestuariibius insulae TaxID=2058287 RepID=UPI00345EB25B
MKNPVLSLALLFPSVSFFCGAPNVLIGETVTCVDKSDSQIIEEAVEAVVTFPTLNLLVSDEELRKKIREGLVPYRDADDFISSNPNCCKIFGVGQDLLAAFPHISKLEDPVRISVSRRIRARLDGEIQYFPSLSVESFIERCQLTPQNE